MNGRKGRARSHHLALFQHFSESRSTSSTPVRALYNRLELVSTRSKCLLVLFDYIIEQTFSRLRTTAGRFVSSLGFLFRLDRAVKTVGTITRRRDGSEIVFRIFATSDPAPFRNFRTAILTRPDAIDLCRTLSTFQIKNGSTSRLNSNRHYLNCLWVNSFSTMRIP